MANIEPGSGINIMLIRIVKKTEQDQVKPKNKGLNGITANLERSGTQILATL